MFASLVPFFALSVFVLVYLDRGSRIFIDRTLKTIKVIKKKIERVEKQQQQQQRKK